MRPLGTRAAFLAKIYLKPLLDIGTGILNGLSRPMGADIRFILPGRCLLCYGGIAGLETAHGDARLDWRVRRAGSLRSLNQIATGFGLRLLEDFVGGRLQSHCWLQIDFGASGLPQLNHPEVPSVRGCVFCAAQLVGDEGLRSPSAGLFNN